MTDAFGRMDDWERRKEYQNEIERRDEIINSDKQVIADLHNETARLDERLAHCEAALEQILHIADTSGRRIETAMDGCDKITELCQAAMSPSQDISGKSAAPSSHTKEYRPLFGLSKPEGEA
jgi:septal ring factor EnvC (AmiA/AmiB activator)